MESDVMRVIRFDGLRGKKESEVMNMESDVCAWEVRDSLPQATQY